MIFKELKLSAVMSVIKISARNAFRGPITVITYFLVWYNVFRKVISDCFEMNLFLWKVE